MIKRRLGETLSSRGFRRQNRAILLKVVTHDILIILCREVFYRAGQKEIGGRGSCFAETGRNVLAEASEAEVAAKCPGK